MTSNIGARLITDKKTSFGFVSSENEAENDYAAIKEMVLGELKKAFRPEFLNRVDDIIVFHKLNELNIKQIAEKMLKNLCKRLKNLEIEIEFEDSCLDAVSKAGFDAVYGARPLRRAIQSSIEDLISEKILDGSIKKGDRLICRFEEGKYVFEK